MGMKEYVAKKLFAAALTIFGSICINFLIFRILPGDPLRMIIKDPRVKPEAMERLRRRFGLDKPLWVQFVVYLTRLAQGDMGMSFWQKRPVLEVVLDRLWPTVLLVGSAFLISLVIGVVTGAIVGWKRRSKMSALIYSVSLVVYMIPTFWLGILLLLVFGYWFGLFPLGGMKTPGIKPGPIGYWLDVLNHMVLPLIALIFWYFGEYVVVMRSAMLDVLTEDYITTARAKGLRERVIMWDHAVRNALLPVTTLTAINAGWIVAGAIEAEIVFSWPGVGRLIYDALMKRDYPLLQGTFLVLTVSVVLANLLADIVYGYLDPRVREEAAKL